LRRNRESHFTLACYRGELLHDMGAMADARTAYEEALLQARDDANRCRAQLGIAAVKRVTDHLDQGLAALIPS
jgi:hypothetical protein